MRSSLRTVRGVCKVCQKGTDEKDKDGWPTTFFGSRETSVACGSGSGTLRCDVETSEEEVKARYARLQWDNYMGVRPVGSGIIDGEQGEKGGTMQWEDHMTSPERRDELLAEAEGWSLVEEAEGRKTNNRNFAIEHF